MFAAPSELLIATPLSQYSERLLVRARARGPLVLFQVGAPRRRFHVVQSSAAATSATSLMLLRSSQSLNLRQSRVCKVAKTCLRGVGLYECVQDWRCRARSAARQRRCALSGWRGRNTTPAAPLLRW